MLVDTVHCDATKLLFTNDESLKYGFSCINLDEVNTKISEIFLLSNTNVIDTTDTDISCGVNLCKISNKYLNCLTDNNCTEVKTSVITTDDAYCMMKNSTSAPLDLFVNDIGAINKSTLVLIKGSAPATITIDSNYNIIITPNTDYIGTFTFQYFVFSTTGVVSNTSTITIEVISSGETSIFKTCN